MYCDGTPRSIYLGVGLGAARRYSEKLNRHRYATIPSTQKSTQTPRLIPPIQIMRLIPLVLLIAAANALRAGNIHMKASLPHDFVSMHVKYTLNDPAAVLPAFALPVEGDAVPASAEDAPSSCDAFMKIAREGTGLSYCGLDATRSKKTGQVVGGFASVEGDTLFERTAHSDAAALLRHVEAVKPITDKIASAATLDEVCIHGPAAEIAKCKDVLGDGASYFELEPGGYSSLKKVADGVPLTLQLLSVHSTLTVSNWDAAKPLMDAYVAATSKETGCVFCGFARSGDTLFLREGFGSVPELGKHTANAGGAMDALLAGPATLVSNGVHGGRVNVLEVMRVLREGNLDGIYGKGVKTDIFWKEVGIQRFERVQSMFGFTF